MARWNDFSDNPVYVAGSSVNLAWQAPSDVAFSIALYQANLTDGNVIGGFEYITSVFSAIVSWSICLFVHNLTHVCLQEV
jgi:hypothetical protein